jgi:HK97 family phage major capsid protein
MQDITINHGGTRSTFRNLPTDLPTVQREIRKLSPRAGRLNSTEAKYFSALTLRRRQIEASATRSAKRTARTPAPKAAAPKATTPVRTTPAPPRHHTRAQYLDAIVRSGVVDDTATLSRGLLRDLALRDLETRSKELSPASQDRLDALLRDRSPECDGKLLARHIITTGRPAYRSAWLKSISTSTPAFTPAERLAIEDYLDCRNSIDRHAHADTARQFAERAARGDTETRAMDEGTGSAGGFAVPYALDPSISVVAGGVSTVQLLKVAKTVLVTTNNYHAWTAPSTGFATDAEAAVTADNSPTFAGPDIPIYAARDYVPFSVEFGQDQPGWAENAAALFGSAYAEYLSSKTAVGSGTNDVTGIFSRMANTTSSPSHITVGSPGTLAAADLANTWAALPERYRVDPSCAWIMSPSAEQQVAALAAPSVTNGLGPEDFVTNRATGQRLLYGRPVMAVSDAPSWTGTSGAANVCVVGAFSSYVVAQRIAGYSIELVPLLRDVSTGRPTGQRAFLATARVGGDVIDPNAFRILSNS